TTVLEAAEDAGLELPYSCRAGVCSTCRTRVVRGAVTMMTNYALEPWEVAASYVLCCQALPASPELELTDDERRHELPDHSDGRECRRGTSHAQPSRPAEQLQRRHAS